jgi:predicted alpha-1,2-mannosidase
MTRSILSLVMMLGAVSAFGQAASGRTPYEYVNPFIGTAGDGHTFPGAVVPFGMVQLSPDTDAKHYKESYRWCAGYRYEDGSIMGFSHTHFSGTGHSDLGDVLVMPTLGEVRTDPGEKDKPGSGYRSRFRHQDEQAQPGYYSVLLADYGIRAELTAGTRVGVHRYTFTQGGDANVIVDLLHSIYQFDDKVRWAQLRAESPTLLTGFRLTNGWAPSRYLYFALELSKPVSWAFRKEDESTYHWVKSAGLIADRAEVVGRTLKAVASFKVADGEQLLVRFAFSPVSREGALANLKSEAADLDFDAARARARTAWERELGRLTVQASEKDMEIFYTAAYHALIAPALYMDVDGRYRGPDGDIHKARGFANHTVFSLWDTFRAEHPLLTLLAPERVPDLINSLLAFRRESPHGVLPIWPFHGNETWCMIGYHAVPVIADAVVKGFSGFDSNEALAACIASADARWYGGLGHYIDKGYAAIDQEIEAASKTLEYAYDDYAVAEMAHHLGREPEAERFARRAGNWRNVFDTTTRFVRARKADGSWREPFDPLEARYGGDFTEGNAWQYTWFVPHDVEGLVRAMGGQQRFVQRLDQLFTIRDTEGKLAKVEDISGLIGQYAHGNEPSQHIAYLYVYAGQPWRTQERLNQIMTGLFSNQPDGICGNEDCGQMSAWYVFSSLGFYPVCPASGVYVIGAPRVAKATLALPDGKRFEVVAEDLIPGNIYVQSVELNGKTWKKAWISHEDIVAGGRLVFEMGARPNTSWATSPEALPPSLTPRKPER